MSEELAFGKQKGKWKYIFYLDWSPPGSDDQTFKKSSV